MYEVELGSFCLSWISWPKHNHHMLRYSMLDKEVIFIVNLSVNSFNVTLYKKNEEQPEHIIVAFHTAITINLWCIITLALFENYVFKRYHTYSTHMWPNFRKQSIYVHQYFCNIQTMDKYTSTHNYASVMVNSVSALIIKSLIPLCSPF